MPIASDWTIDTTNRRIYHSANTTVYTVNELYSYIQETFDETGFLGFPAPFLAATPTSYSLINGWLINEHSTYNSYRFLKGGSIATTSWDAATLTNGIYILTFSTGSYTNAVVGDIGKTVVNGSSNGVLLDFNNTTKEWWVRRVTGTTWVNTTTSITTGTGGNTGGAPTATTGESLYSNLYTIGNLESTTTNTLYLEQGTTEIANYWPNEHIDVVLKVRQASTLISSGFARVYCREYTDLYSHYYIDLSAGGRNPAPLATSNDVNNQTASGTVIGAPYNTVTVTYGAITRDIGDGAGVQPYDVEVDCASCTTLLQVYERLKYITSRASGITLNGFPGQFYKTANVSYIENTQAPFGTFAGGKLFGSRGVWFANVPGSENKPTKLSVTDSNNVVRVPPASITFSLTGLQTNSEIRILRTSDSVELAGTESSTTSFSYNYTYASDIPVFAVVFHVDYLPIQITGLTLTAVDQSIPVQQTFDRQYSNPA